MAHAKNVSMNDFVCVSGRAVYMYLEVVTARLKYHCVRPHSGHGNPQVQTMRTTLAETKRTVLHVWRLVPGVVLPTLKLAAGGNTIAARASGAMASARRMAGGGGLTPWQQRHG